MLTAVETLLIFYNKKQTCVFEAFMGKLVKLCRESPRAEGAAKA
jgi:hypothetical protein